MERSRHGVSAIIVDIDGFRIHNFASVGNMTAVHRETLERFRNL